jgi:methyl-accepting chemotaxis protein
MILLRRFRVMTRLAVGFLMVSLCVAGLWLVATVSAHNSTTVSRTLSSTLARVEAAKQVKYRSAELYGKQTGYAFDIARGADRAIEDTAPSRAAFLATQKQLGVELDRLAAMPLSAGERRALRDARDQLSAFIKLDHEIIEGFRAGTPDAVRTANTKLLNDVVAVVQRIDTRVDELVDQTRAQAAVAQRTAKESATRTTTLATTLGIVALIGSVLLAIALTLSITRPLDMLRDRFDDIVRGDLTRRLAVTGNDEFTTVGTSFNAFVDKTAEIVRTISRSSDEVATASDALTEVSGRLVVNSAETSSRSATVSTTADTVSRKLQSIASAAAELTTALHKVDVDANEAAQIGDQAMAAARTTGALLARLNESSQAIGNVVEVITTIAQQTGLLALNATIESARAGEAGRGFAVVASEVRELAQGTANSTEDITAKVASIQQDTTTAIDAIAQITEIVSRLGGHQTNVAAAMEVQATTTNDMSDTINSAAQDTGEIAASVSRIADGAQATTDGVGETRRAAEQLTEMSHGLREMVGQFQV